MILVRSAIGCNWNLFCFYILDHDPHAVKLSIMEGRFASSSSLTSGLGTGRADNTLVATTAHCQPARSAGNRRGEKRTARAKPRLTTWPKYSSCLSLTPCREEAVPRHADARQPRTKSSCLS